MIDPTSWLLQVAAVIETAIGRRDTQHAVFHGCYDWHSAVHGHWALLRIGRVTGETGLTELVDQRLTPTALAAELDLLREQPAFELPYGRAWLLRLAIEHAEVTDHPHKLRAIADEAAASLVALYTAKPPDPASREYANAAWALVQLACYARAIRDKLLATTVQRHVEAHFLDAGDVPGFDDDRDNPDFFSVRGNWLYLLAHGYPKGLDRAVADAALDERVLEPVAIGKAAHHYGINWSRAWTLHRLALQFPDEPLYRRAYEAHVAVGLRDHDRGVGNYHTYDHWVPQFAVYALTEDAT